jgi:hypothetical protein
MAPVRIPAVIRRQMVQAAIVVLAAFIATTIVACRPTTIVAIDLDLRSYLPDDAASLTAQVPVADALRVYLLPGIQVDDVSAGPDEDMRTGSLVSIPSSDDLTAADPALEITVTIGIQNTGESTPVPESSLTVRIGAESSADIYTDGSVAATASSGAVGPGEESILDLVAVINAAHPAFSFLVSGAFRIGVFLEMDPNTLEVVPVQLDIAALRATVTLRPFGFIQSEVLP